MEGAVCDLYAGLLPVLSTTEGREFLSTWTARIAGTSSNPTNGAVIQPQMNAPIRLGLLQGSGRIR